MKILIDHQLPFLLAHGGLQIQIERTKQALEATGVEVEYLRWWDDAQKGDIIHFFGLPSLGFLQMAHAKNLPVIATHLLTSTCNRPVVTLFLQGLITRALYRLPGWGLIRNQTTWPVLRSLGHLVVGLDAEKKVLAGVFGVPRDRISIVPLGLDDVYRKHGSNTSKKSYLVTTGTITARKNSVELARHAKNANVPVLFIGKPYAYDDPYWIAFKKEIDGRIVLHIDHVKDPEDLATLIREARGFVIASRYENWCLSAHEAAGCGLPLLLPDQRWARERFGLNASYFKTQSGSRTVKALKEFYERAPRLSCPPMPDGWDKTAEALISIYQRLGTRIS